MEKNRDDDDRRGILSDSNDKESSQDVFEGYGGRNESLYSYSALMGVFGLIFALFLLLFYRFLGLVAVLRPERLRLLDDLPEEPAAAE